VTRDISALMCSMHGIGLQDFFPPIARALTPFSILCLSRVSHQRLFPPAVFVSNFFPLFSPRFFQKQFLPPDKSPFSRVSYRILAMRNAASFPPPILSKLLKIPPSFLPFIPSRVNALSEKGSAFFSFAATVSGIHLSSLI